MWGWRWGLQASSGPHCRPGAAARDREGRAVQAWSHMSSCSADENSTHNPHTEPHTHTACMEQGGTLC